MKKTVFDPENRLGERIAEMDRTELCALVSELCERIREDAGMNGYRGGVYPDNISLNADGIPAIGPAKMSDQEGQELRFIAPELFWGGKVGPAADVYSLGMLLYYGITGGKLPFDEQGEEQAQTERMNGRAIPVPAEAGRFLGEIIAKATAFKAVDRYQQVGELQAMVDSCLRGGYSQGASRSQALFHKDKGELSDIEQIMVNIIAQEPGEAEEPHEAAAEEGSFPELGEKPEPREAPTDPTEDEEMARIRALFNAPPQEPRFENEAVPQLDGDEQEQLNPVPLAMGGENEDVRVYQPTPHPRTEKNQTPPPRQPIPILTVESNPELAPVVPVTSVEFARADDRQTGKAAEVRRRQRPVALVLLLCALLILSAIMGNAMLQHGGTLLPKRLAPTPAPADDASGTVTIPTAPPDQSGGVYGDTPFDYSSLDQPQEGGEVAIADQSGQEHRYEVVASDLSWTAARDACREAGGYLAVISTEEEYIQVTQLVIESGLSRVWLGCHRIDDQLVWENTDTVKYYPWDYYEPSYYDDYDGIAEDYVMLWYHNGRWVYNDSRNDPVADYPELYSGVMGYVIEYGEQPHDYGLD